MKAHSLENSEAFPSTSNFVCVITINGSVILLIILCYISIHSMCFVDHDIVIKCSCFKTNLVLKSVSRYWTFRVTDNSLD